MLKVGPIISNGVIISIWLECNVNYYFCYDCDETTLKWPALKPSFFRFNHSGIIYKITLKSIRVYVI